VDKNGGYKIISVQKDTLYIEGVLPTGEKLSYNGVKIVHTVIGGAGKTQGGIISEDAARISYILNRNFQVLKK
jgi:hypothetical protein